MKEPKIYIPNMGRVSIKEAIKLLSDSFIENGEYCDQTISDLRDALKYLLKNKVDKNN
jgi:hypothetical protein